MTRWTDTLTGLTFLPSWHILDRDTGTFVEAVTYGSVMDLALMAGNPVGLEPNELAVNVLSGDIVKHSPAATSCGSMPRGIDC